MGVFAPRPGRVSIRPACALLVTLLISACGGQQTAPTPLASPVVSIEVTGPSTLLPGATGRFRAVSRHADGTTTDDTRVVLWRSSNTGVLTIDAIGVATSRDRGGAAVSATLGPLSRSASVVVEENGTFILSGRITSSVGASVASALVEVVDGIGAGLRSTSDDQGAYQLAGVAGPIRLRISASGLDPAEVELIVSENAERSFTLQRQSVRWKISGTVWVHGASGALRLPNASLSGWISTDRFGLPFAGGLANADGAFEFTVATETTRLRLVATDAKGLTWQPCAIDIAPKGDMTVDIHLADAFDSGGFPIPSTFPVPDHTLTGTIYEETAGGRRGVPGALVRIDATGIGDGPWAATTRTGSDGRYLLCNSRPSLDGMVIDANGFETAYANASFSGAQTLDVLLRRR